MSTPAQLAFSTPKHRNHGLFSDHYLDRTLPERPDWRALAGEAEATMRAVARLFEGYEPSGNEAQTEHELVRPVLELLGHTFEVQAPLHTPAGTKRPDYVFYRDAEARAALKNAPLTDELLRSRAFAVGDAKHWDRPLDTALSGKAADPFTNANPSYQIAFYMQHSGAEWGVLTNGRLWRLYHARSAHKLDRFYEVDLHDLATGGDVGRFLYFYAFFHRSAFEPHPLGVGALLRESTEYALAVGESLKRQVYDALRHLAQGFLDYAPNGFGQPSSTAHRAGVEDRGVEDRRGVQLDAPTTDASTPPPDATAPPPNDPTPPLREIYDASLIVLYRLLFALYAEARELLPVRESEDYRASYSLQAIKQEVARSLDLGRRLQPGSAILWPRLRELFRIVDQGDPPLKVATFNGGLFDPERHPFLERYTVGDAHLQAAIDKLARVGGQWVDYRDLAERHLGTIYEGLLEYHLRPLAEPRDGWTVDLLNDNGERKATGSYYTPDFIVKYMVDQTVGPVLREAVAGIEGDEARADAVLAVNVLDPAMGSGHFLVEATESIARFLVELNVAPPGVRAGGEAELAYWKRRVVQSCIYGVDMNPLAVELAKLSLWLSTVAKDRPLSFLDHHLRTGNSLVGARIADLQAAPHPTAPSQRRGNPVGRPPVGRPPVGRPGRSRKEQQQAAAGQLSMLDSEAFRQSMSTAVDSMWLIESSPAHTVEQVKQQERAYAGLRESLTRRYSRLADLVSARSFGVAADPALWTPLADYATGRVMAAPAGFDALLDRGGAAAQERRFFHWELEYPEVFYDRFGAHRGEAGGFDAVIGNPPYVRQEELGPFKPYFAAAYPETYHGVADLYVYFYQQGLRVTRAGGRMSYIVTNKWLRAGYGEPLRAYFADQGALEQIVDFGHAPIFEDADVFPCILVLRKPRTDPALAEPTPIEPAISSSTARPESDGHITAPPGVGEGSPWGSDVRVRPSPDHREAPLSPPPATGSPTAGRLVRVVAFPRAALNKVDLGAYVREHGHDVPLSRFGPSAWSLEKDAVDDLMAKIRAGGVPLAEYAGAKPYRGVLTGLNDAFLIDTPTKERLVREDPRSAEVLKPYLRGQDVKRWSPEWRGLWMIVLKSSGDHAWPWSTAGDQAEDVFGQTYPALHGHMKRLEEKLRKRWDKGRYWWELRSCAYYDAFEKPTILWKDLSFHSEFCWLPTPSFTNDLCFILPTDDLWLLAVLNAPLMWMYMWHNVIHGKDEVLRLKNIYTQVLPIAPPTDAARAEAEPAVARLTEIAKAQQQARHAGLDWLRTEFAVETPGQKLEDLASLEPDAFVEEVRKRRPRAAGRLTPSALAALRAGYMELATPQQQLRAEAAALERRLSALVNAAYALTPEEEALLWATAPPRMPRY